MAILYGIADVWKEGRMPRLEVEGAGTFDVEEGEDPEEATALARRGTPYDEYAKRFMVGTAEEIVERLQPRVEAGVNYFIVYLPRVAYEPAMVERFAREVIPEFA